MFTFLDWIVESLKKNKDVKNQGFKGVCMINKFRKDLKGASNYELSLFHTINILLCLRVCIYHYIKFKNRDFKEIKET